MDKRYLQAMDNSIMKSIRNPELKVIQHLIDNYGQAREKNDQQTKSACKFDRLHINRTI